MSSQMAPMPSSQFAASTESAFAPPARYVRFGSFHLDLRKEELLKDGTRVKLQGKVFQALVALLEKPGEVVTREALRNRLWPSDTHVNYDANVNTTVNKLRLVLGDSLDQPAPQENQEPEEKSSAAAEALSGESKSSLLRAALSSKWFAAGVISLVVAGMLFGAALMLYSHRGI